MSNFLIFARRHDIRTISLDVGYYADVVIPVGAMENAIALDVDRSDGMYHIYILGKICFAKLEVYRLLNFSSKFG